MEQPLVENLHYFWTHPLEGNRSADYATVSPVRSLNLVLMVRSLVPQPASFLEVGCNCGRNLYYLQEAGYGGDLAGVDINDCSAAVQEHFPGLTAQFVWGPAEEVLPQVPCNRFDLVFTMAALTHVHPDSIQKVAAAMADIARHYIIIIEDEYRGWPLCNGAWARRFFPHGYKSLFEDLGFKQLIEFPGLGWDRDVDDYFTARVFHRGGSDGTA